ncbi:ATP-binding protein [uncultured Phascolarctobacterium sp.]|uniref:ATP-binding protein n=1 Tax=uncultured Phascolarctobacterium sp. TaxID=512296 RepID=UPI0025D1CA8A|nr:ATP-binding protein [uncultured Phascolarctobacterium sp.]
MSQQWIVREAYLNKLIALKDKQLIKVITGVRRSGKSTLLEIFQEYLVGHGIEREQIISINFEDYEYRYLRNPDQLYQYIKERLSENSYTYIFLDEIQHVDNFQEVVDGLYIKKNVDIYITGSNANMLSGELATLLSGRYVEISILPLSFKEYAENVADNKTLMQKYNDYITYGSFPYVLELEKNPGEVQDYIEGIYNTVVVKDIIGRKRVTDPMMLESIVLFTLDNIGNQLSTKKIADTMTSAGRKIDVRTVEKYINSLQECYILYQARRYNIKGKQLLRSLEKYYAVDMGLRYAMLGSKAFDVGHVLENVVYLELLRRGYKVYVGKVDELEVDFVAVKPQGITYFQISATVRDSKTLERELASLRAINDSHPKYLLTLDEDPDANYDGIIRTNVLNWLMQNK